VVTTDFDLPGIRSLQSDPKGTALAAGFWDNRVVLFDSQKRRVRWVSDHQHGPVFGLAFSPDGQHLAAASLDKSIWVLDVATGRALAPVLHTDTEPFTLGYSPAGDRLAAGAIGQVVVWDVVTGAELNRFGDPPSRVDSVAWSKGEPLLAAADFSSHIYVWNLALQFRIGEWAMAMPDGTPCGPNRVAWLEGNRLLLAWSYSYTGLTRFIEVPPVAATEHLLRLAEWVNRGACDAQGALHLLDEPALAERLAQLRAAAKAGALPPSLTRLLPPP
jgi:hypothetical protein